MVRLPTNLSLCLATSLLTPIMISSREFAFLRERGLCPLFHPPPNSRARTNCRTQYCEYLTADLLVDIVAFLGIIYDVAVPLIIIELDIGDLSHWLIKSIVLPPAAKGHPLFVLYPYCPCSPQPSQS